MRLRYSAEVDSHLVMLFAVAFTTAEAQGGAEWSIDEWAQRSGALVAKGYLETWLQAAHADEVVAQHKETVITAWLVARLRRKRFGVALRDVGLLCPFGWCFAFEGRRHTNWRRCARLQRRLHSTSRWSGLVLRVATTWVRRSLLARADVVYSVSHALAELHGYPEAEVVR